MVIVSNPRTFKVPDWFLNRQKDHKDGRFAQVTSSALDTKLRDDLERLKKIRYGSAPVTDNLSALCKLRDSAMCKNGCGWLNLVNPEYHCWLLWQQPVCKEFKAFHGAFCAELSLLDPSQARRRVACC